ncbi:hypothetical protein D3C73_1050640 [compost metagenome]
MQQAIQSARTRCEALRAGQSGARGISGRHAVAHGEGGVQRFGFVRLIVHQLPQARRLRGANAQRVVQRLRPQPQGGGRRRRRAHSARRGGGVKGCGVARAQRFAQPQRHFVPGNDGVRHLALRHPAAYRQRQGGCDRHHAGVQHRGAVRVVDLTQVGDGRVGEGGAVGVHAHAAEDRDVAGAWVAVVCGAAIAIGGRRIGRRPASGEPVQQGLRQAFAGGERNRLLAQAA